MEFVIDTYNALREALHMMCQLLEENGVSMDTVFACRLVANELLSNVLQHEEGSARLKVTEEEKSVRLYIGGSAFTPPEISVCSEVYAECGRGLYLVGVYGRRLPSKEGILIEVDKK